MNYTCHFWLNVSSRRLFQHQFYDLARSLRTAVTSSAWCEWKRAGRSWLPPSFEQHTLDGVFFPIIFYISLYRYTSVMDPDWVDVFPIWKWWIFQPAMLVYQRVYPKNPFVCPKRCRDYRYTTFLFFFGWDWGVLNPIRPGMALDSYEYICQLVLGWKPQGLDDINLM